MWDGTVDEAWAKQHHRIWYDEEIAKGNVPEALPPDKATSAAGRMPPPAGKVHPAG
jgi:formate dehydrogenase subunit gamma